MLSQLHSTPLPAGRPATLPFIGDNERHPLWEGTHAVVTVSKLYTHRLSYCTGLPLRLRRHMPGKCTTLFANKTSAYYPCRDRCTRVVKAWDTNFPLERHAWSGLHVLQVSDHPLVNVRVSIKDAASTRSLARHSHEIPAES